MGVGTLKKAEGQALPLVGSAQPPSLTRSPCSLCIRRDGFLHGSSIPDLSLGGHCPCPIGVCDGVSHGIREGLAMGTGRGGVAMDSESGLWVGILAMLPPTRVIWNNQFLPSVLQFPYLQNGRLSVEPNCKPLATESVPLNKHL